MTPGRVDTKQVETSQTSLRCAPKTVVALPKYIFQIVLYNYTIVVIVRPCSVLFGLALANSGAGRNF